MEAYKLSFNKNWLDLTEVLEMMNEIRQFATLVHLVASRHHALGQRSRSARENADFGNLRSDTTLMIKSNISNIV